MSNDKPIGPGSIVTITTYRDGEGLWNTAEGVLVNGSRTAWLPDARVHLVRFYKKWEGYDVYYATLAPEVVVETPEEVEVVRRSLLGTGGAPTGPVEVGPTVARLPLSTLRPKSPTVAADVQAAHDRASREFRALSPEDKVQRMRDAGIREPEPRPWLLALTGYAGSGKDTVAGMLQALDPNVRTVAFADAVRELTGKLYGLPGDREWWQAHKGDEWYRLQVVGPGEHDAQIDGAKMRLPAALGGLTREGQLFSFPNAVILPNATGTLRDLLIHVGMSMRALDPDFWVRIALRSIENYRSAAHPVVVTDLRFANEAEALRAAGAATVRLRADRAPEPQGEADRAINEIPIELFSRQWTNHGTLDDLRAFLVSIYERGSFDP